MARRRANKKQTIAEPKWAHRSASTRMQQVSTSTRLRSRPACPVIARRRRPRFLARSPLTCAPSPTGWRAVASRPWLWKPQASTGSPHTKCSRNAAFGEEHRAPHWQLPRRARLCPQAGACSVAQQGSEAAQPGRAGLRQVAAPKGGHPELGECKLERGYCRAPGRRTCSASPRRIAQLVHRPSYQNDGVVSCISCKARPNARAAAGHARAPQSLLRLRSASLAGLPTDHRQRGHCSRAIEM